MLDQVKQFKVKDASAGAGMARLPQTNVAIRILSFGAVSLEPGDVCLLGLLGLLLEDVVPLGDAPVVGAGHGGAEGPPPGWLQLLPVLPAGPRPHPRLGVHPQPARPRDVLLAPGRRVPALSCKLLCACADVVGLEAAAAADVADTQLIGLAGELVHLKPDE